MSMGLRIFTSRVWELPDISELDLCFFKKDPDFTAIAKKFLLNLTRDHEIMPLPKCLCLDCQDVTGIGSTCD